MTYLSNLTVIDPMRPLQVVLVGSATDIRSSYRVADHVLGATQPLGFLASPRIVRPPVTLIVPVGAGRQPA